MNRGASLLAWLTRELAFEWAPVAPLLSAGLKAAGLFGSSAGALGVEIRGSKNGFPAACRASIVAAKDGEQIVVLPAAIMAPRLAQQPGLYRGLIPLDSWLSRQELITECDKRGLSLLFSEVPV